MRNFHVALCCLLLLSVTSCSNISNTKNKKKETSGASQSNGLDLKVEKFTLSNGLTLIVFENKKLPIFSYHTFFDVGGRHEGPGTTGATHFLEHMMFKGAKKFGPGIFDTTIEKNGGNNNAYTTFDSTVYHENLPSVNSDGDRLVDKIIDLEADRMENLLLEKESFEKERQVVLEERKMRYENSPSGKLYLSLMQNMFEGTPYGGSVIGDEKDLLSLNRDQVRDFFKKFYKPDNAIVVVAGDVDADRIYRLVKDKYGHMNSSSKEVKAYKESKNDEKLYAHRGRYRRDVHLNASNPTPMFMLAYPGYKVGARVGYAIDILGMILGSGDSSYLKQNLVKAKRPILSSVTSAHYSLRYNGLFYIYGALLPKVSLNKAKKKVISYLKKGCDKAVDERALQKTKNFILKGYFSQIQSNNGVAGFLGNLEHFYGDYTYYKEEMKIYDSITIDEVKKTCRDLFNDDRYIYATVWNKNPKKSKK